MKVLVPHNFYMKVLVPDNFPMTSHLRLELAVATHRIKSSREIRSSSKKFHSHISKC